MKSRGLVAGERVVNLNQFIRVDEHNCKGNDVVDFYLRELLCSVKKMSYPLIELLNLGQEWFYFLLLLYVLPQCIVELEIVRNLFFQMRGSEGMLLREVGTH